MFAHISLKNSSDPPAGRRHSRREAAGPAAEQMVGPLVAPCVAGRWRQRWTRLAAALFDTGLGLLGFGLWDFVATDTDLGILGFGILGFGDEILGFHCYRVDSLRSCC
jgi:hypothetical protein